MPVEISLPPIKDIVNERFEPLFLNKDRYLILWGGRGSSKSMFAAQKLIYRCLTEKYFRYLLIRKVADTVKDSQYQTIKDEVQRWGLSQFFKFTVNPLEITCRLNGNKFLCRGLDNPAKIKSVKDPSGAWYEEGNQCTEEDFITVTTSIRSRETNYLQEIFSFNPEYPGGDFKDFWIYKYFFEGKGGDENSFSDSVVVDIPNRDSITYDFTVHHSTYVDNRWITPDAIATYEALKKTNFYWYQVFCLGIWGKKQTGGEFYKDFDSTAHVMPRKYDAELPLHISFDENVNPYLTCTIWQVQGIRLHQIDEVCLAHPRNTLRDVCREFEKRYMAHTTGLFVYGDSTSRKQDVKLEKGYDFYKLVQQHLERYHPRFRVPKANPSVVMRGNFINSVFKEGFGDASILFDGVKCKNTVNDYINLKEAADGTKSKVKIADPDTKVRYEPWGHCSDANDYLICEVLKELFTLYQRGNREITAKIAPRQTRKY